VWRISGRVRAPIQIDRPLGVVVTPCSGDVSARVLTADTMNAENTLAAPNAVAPAPFDAFTPTNGALELELPPKSLVTLAWRS
jgi:alpha-L-arabinofuranosidase